LFDLQTKKFNMVRIGSTSKRGKHSIVIKKNLVTRVVVTIGVFYFIATAGFTLARFDQDLNEEESRLRYPTLVTLEKQDQERRDPCFYSSLDDLSEEELQPVANQRHMVSQLRRSQATIPRHRDAIPNLHYGQ
jgi:hypothetical protein